MGRYEITRYIVIPAEGKVCVYFDVVIALTEQERRVTNQYAELAEGKEPLASDAWGNDDLVAALAASLNVKVSLVSIAPIPEPPAAIEPE